MAERPEMNRASSAGSLLADLSAESYVSLALWIQEATGGLCDDARKRIRPEIESHYADAYEHYRELGYADIQAQNAAMAAMGRRTPRPGSDGASPSQTGTDGFRRSMAL